MAAGVLLTSHAWTCGHERRPPDLEPICSKSDEHDLFLLVHVRIHAMASRYSLLQANRLNVVVDDHKAGSITVNPTAILFACNMGDQREAQQALIQYGAQVGPKVAACVAELLPAEQSTVDIRLKGGHDTVDLGQIANNTLVAAIAQERLFTNDPTVAAEVEWLSYGLSKDKETRTCVIKLRSGSGWNDPTSKAKPIKGRVGANKAFMVRVSQLYMSITPDPAQIW